jgi:hypothetical protein
MKFAAVTPAAGREAMRERHRRGRVAAPTIRTRYPQLKSLQLDFEFSDNTEFLPSPQVTVFHPPAPAYFCFACPYSDCSGEFDLTGLVDLAVSSRDSNSDGQMSCAGMRHRGVACTLCLEYSISPHLS